MEIIENKNLNISKKEATKSDSSPTLIPARALYRFFAGMIDFILLFSPTIFAGIFARTSVILGMSSGVEAIILFTFVAAWFYFVGFESSRFQATPGKMLIGIKVVDLNGEKVNIKIANIRFWGKMLAILFFFLGCLIIPFTPKKQGLHDYLAKTLVISK